jgi:hypothetical protein
MKLDEQRLDRPQIFREKPEIIIKLPKHLEIVRFRQGKAIAIQAN